MYSSSGHLALVVDIQHKTTDKRQMASCEYRTLHECYQIIKDGIQQSPRDTADCLIPTNLLSEDDCSYIRNESHDDGEKARKIVDAVLQQVKAEATLFHTFIGAIKQLPWIGFVDYLEKVYGQQCKRKNENEKKDNDTLYVLEEYQRELSLQLEELQNEKNKLERDLDTIPMTCFTEYQEFCGSLESLCDRWDSLLAEQKKVLTMSESMVNKCFESTKPRADSCFKGALARKIVMTKAQTKCYELKDEHLVKLARKRKICK